MKRHEALFPLSHDHHHALVEARYLRLSEDDADTMTARLLEFWTRSLERHFKQEEEILLPRLALQTPLEPDVRAQTLGEHAGIRSLIDSLIIGAEPRADLLRSIGNALTDHIRFEENNLFPAVEATLSEDELWLINRELKASA